MGSNPILGASPQVVGETSQVFKFSKNSERMKQDKSIYNYDQRFIGYRRNIEVIHNGKVTLCFLDHLGALNFRLLGYQSMLVICLQFYV
jgi:hypothetical protein